MWYVCWVLVSVVYMYVVYMCGVCVVYEVGAGQWGVYVCGV